MIESVMKSDSEIHSLSKHYFVCKIYILKHIMPLIIRNLPMPLHSPLVGLADKWLLTCTPFTTTLFQVKYNPLDSRSSSCHYPSSCVPPHPLCSLVYTFAIYFTKFHQFRRGNYAKMLHHIFTFWIMFATVVETSRKILWFSITELLSKVPAQIFCYNFHNF